MIIKTQSLLSFPGFMEIFRLLAPRSSGLLILITILASSATKVFPQTNWTKYAQNPVLGVGQSGSWDDEAVENGSVLFDGTIYHMLYSGSDGINNRIGHAISHDGISWTKDTLNPVLDIGTPGSWDDNHLLIPCVLLIDSTFHMWYDGNDGSKERIGHATSPDGTSWTKDALNPVIDVGSPGSWDDAEVFPTAGSVIFEGTIYHLWYGGVTASTGIYAIGHATSPDGIGWTKDTFNPVMSASSSNDWDRHGVIPGTVLFDGTTYNAWYSGHGGDFRYRVGYATSLDGVDWERETPNNPVLDFGQSGSWDFVQAWNGSVLFDSVAQVYKMWFTGGDFGSGRIGYATTSMFTGIDDNISTQIPREFSLAQNYPNPFNPSTRISYSIPSTGFVTMKVYDILGREVQVLVREFQEAGKYSINFDASLLSNGVYFYKLQVGDLVETKKMLLIQ